MTKACDFCGKPLVRKRYGTYIEKPVQFSVRRYCGNPCYAKGRMVKDPNPWTVRTRNRPIVRAAKRAACERCSSGSMLIVHHRDENPQNNSPENLETLCRRCHIAEHSPQPRRRSDDETIAKL